MLLEDLMDYFSGKVEIYIIGELTPAYQGWYGLIPAELLKYKVDTLLGNNKSFYLEIWLAKRKDKNERN